MMSSPVQLVLKLTQLYWVFHFSTISSTRTSKLYSRGSNLSFLFSSIMVSERSKTFSKSFSRFFNNNGIFRLLGFSDLSSSQSYFLFKASSIFSGFAAIVFLLLCNSWLNELIFNCKVARTFNNCASYR